MENFIFVQFDQPPGALIFCYCSDINLFFIDYPWCELCNIWMILFENNTRSITIEE